MRTEIEPRGIFIKTLRAFFLAVAGFCALAAAAQAAPAPTPALRSLAITAPTHLPPVQSETQRVTVEAEGGTFALEPQTAEGEGTFSAGRFGLIEQITAGSNIIEILFAFEPYAVGELVTGEAFPVGTTITGVSGTEEKPILELSNPATKSEEFGSITTSSNVVTSVTTTKGEFRVGDQISAPVLSPGTTVTAIGPGTLTLSDYPTQAGTYTLIGSETTAPILFDASAATVQAAFEALPAFEPGMFTVTGGPGGDAEHPYFIAFGGPLADEDVAELKADRSGLVGEHAFVHVLTTVPGGRGTGEIYLFASNVGGLPTSGMITAHLGPLPAGIVTTGPAEGVGWTCGGTAGESEVTCETTESIRSLHSAPSR